ncbi:flagellar filament capping protein FliD [Sporosarcina limicola]|uniref:Flagellar hook-associated protein 2 n=1 Tax=Sporosarcina limicola TaxID=34101 RepID=A0A927MPJ9_9BACL|nr:flagellar filament capping protein FliD [Sporosarcina limicola]MBE1555026.1 flagellar hook-associated protein 2 [Sporosarcina limicola]
MRISGLATGMEPEKIISDLMKAHRIPLDRITQKKQYLQWQLDDYRNIQRNLKATSEKVSDTIMKSSTLLAKKVNSSNPDAVSIKSMSASAEFSGTISVQRLATQSTLQSSGSIMSPGLSEDSTLQDLGITGSSITITASGSATGVTVAFDPTKDTLKSLIEKVNKQTGVSAFYDSHSGKISLTAKNGGAETIAISGNGNIAEKLKLDNGVSVDGSNAKFKLNGLETERSSNTFQINGFEINLKQVTTSDVTFNSAPDTDKIVDAVVKFVDDYNKMIEELNAKIREPKHRKFQPLSEEQKKEMKENDIKLWEEKAKSGTLSNDPTISAMLTKMRGIMMSSVEGSNGEKIRLSDLGITTTKDYKENGKLVIDADKLKAAIIKDPNKVYEVFAKSSSATDAGGIAVQFREAVVTSEKAIATRAGKFGAVNGNDTFTLGRTMKDINKQIERFEHRLKMTEDRYWKQFTAMERAIQRANAQSANLMNALGGGGGGN